MTDRRQWTDWVSVTLREAAWAPLGVFGLYLLGLTLHLYKIFPLLDVPTHFMGGITITYFYRGAIKQSQKLVGEIPYPIQVLLALTCTGTTVVLWEFTESILDYFLHTHMVLGLFDTLKDMFFGLFGALVLSLLYRKR